MTRAHLFRELYLLHQLSQLELSIDMSDRIRHHGDAETHGNYNNVCRAPGSEVELSLNYKIVLWRLDNDSPAAIVHVRVCNFAVHVSDIPWKGKRKLTMLTPAPKSLGIE